MLYSRSWAPSLPFWRVPGNVGHIPMHLGEKPISPLGRLELKGWWTSGRRESQGLVSVSEIHHSGDDVRNQCVEPRDRQPGRKRTNLKKSKMHGLHVLLPSQGSRSLFTFVSWVLLPLNRPAKKSQIHGCLFWQPRPVPVSITLRAPIYHGDGARTATESPLDTANFFWQSGGTAVKWRQWSNGGVPGEWSFVLSPL